jgi:hypothetical protein|tara:strand:- start:2723 stop:2914 length:192 start_codon:yes stop_codon:yes gene_type:complete
MADRKRFIQPYQRIGLLQKVQEVEVHENVEENHQTYAENEGLKRFRRKTLYLARSFLHSLVHP